MEAIPPKGYSVISLVCIEKRCATSACPNSCRSTQQKIRMTNRASDKCASAVGSSKSHPKRIKKVKWIRIGIPRTVPMLILHGFLFLVTEMPAV